MLLYFGFRFQTEKISVNLYFLLGINCRVLVVEPVNGHFTEFMFVAQKSMNTGSVFICGDLIVPFSTYMKMRQKNILKILIMCVDWLMCLADINAIPQ